MQSKARFEAELQALTRGRYSDWINCTVHLSWPFVRPPPLGVHVVLPDNKTVVAYAVLCGLFIGVLVNWSFGNLFSWMLWPVLVAGPPYCLYYRHCLRLAVASQLRKRILG